MKKPTKVTPKNKFGEWLISNMIQNNMVCEDVAKRLRTSRQCVWNHINDTKTPIYVWVVAYCSLFDADPEFIWQMVCEEKDSVD